MQSSGFSATHEEYNEARRLGRRVSFWVQTGGSERQGNARRFVEEVQVFNVTGSFASADELASKLLKRLREMAAEDLSPWVKLGETIFRARTIVETGRELLIEARVRDSTVLESLRTLNSGPQWSRPQTAPVTYGARSGPAKLTDLAVRTEASSSQDVSMTLEVEWENSRPQQAINYNGVAHEDLIEIGIRVGLLGEEVPARYAQQFRPFGGMSLGSVIDDRDPLADLQSMRVAEGSVEAIARLLVVEQIVGGRRAATIETFQVGPAIHGRRRVRIGWREYPAYGNRPPGNRLIEGVRAWPAGAN